MCHPEPQSEDLGKSGAVLCSAAKCGSAFATPAGPSMPPMMLNELPILCSKEVYDATGSLTGFKLLVQNALSGVAHSVTY